MMGFVDVEYTIPAPIITALENSMNDGKEEMPNSYFVLWRRSDANGDSQHLTSQHLTSSTSADVPILEWIIDTGATQHMTGDSSELRNLRPLEDNVRVGSGALLPVTHIGDAILNLGHLMIGLKDVLLVPESKFKFLSVNQFTSDYPFNFEFSATGYMIKDRTTKRVITSGRRRGNIYPLKTSKEGYFTNRFCEVVEDIWQVKPKNFLFQLSLTDEDIMWGSLFIPPEEVGNHFPMVGIPTETHHLEMLYFTDVRNGQWCMEIDCFQGYFELMMGAFIDEHNLGVGDMIRFYKVHQISLLSRHFFVGFVKQHGDPTESVAAVVDDCPDRGSDSEGIGGGGADNRLGDGGGGSRSGGHKWWKFRLGGLWP